jgi:WD40 repeat protein
LVLDGGEYLRGGQKRRLEVWNNDTRLVQREVEPVLDDDQATLLIPAQNGKFVFTAVREGLEMLDTATLQTKAKIYHVGAILVGARADGKFAVTVDRNHQARIWELEQNLEVTRFTLSAAPLALELSPDGRWLAILRTDYDIELWAIEPADLIAQACTWLSSPCP